MAKYTHVDLEEKVSQTLYLCLSLYVVIKKNKRERFLSFLNVDILDFVHKTKILITSFPVSFTCVYNPRLFVKYLT